MSDHRTPVWTFTVSCSLFSSTILFMDDKSRTMPFTVGTTPPSPEEADPRGNKAIFSAFANRTIFLSDSTLLGMITSSGVVSKSRFANGTSPMSMLYSSRSKSPSITLASSPTSSSIFVFTVSVMLAPKI